MKKLREIVVEAIAEAWNQEEHDKHQAFAQSLEKKHGIQLHIHAHHDDLELAHIRVPKDKQGQGIGSAAMKDVHDYADSLGKRVILNLGDADRKGAGTTSKARLRKFYASHGYVNNKGRNKDFRIRHQMYRRPKK